MSFDWLTGNWKGIPANPEKETFEYWTKESDTSYRGHGFVMVGKDTVWQEIMILDSVAEQWALQVKTPGKNDLTVFSLIEYNPTGFTVVNPRHDFPKKIKYWISDSGLKAEVSGDEKVIPFAFERITTE